MAPQHHGSHQLATYREPDERLHGERVMDDLEMERAPVPRPLSWPVVKEAVYVAGGLLSVVATGFATYYGVVGEVRDSRKDIEALTARVVIIERGRAETLPRFEEQVRLNALQETKLQNSVEANNRTALAVIELGHTVAEQGRVLGEVRTGQAVLEERVGRGMPHDR